MTNWKWKQPDISSAKTKSLEAIKLVKKQTNRWLLPNLIWLKSWCPQIWFIKKDIWCAGLRSRCQQGCVPKFQSFCSGVKSVLWLFQLMTAGILQLMATSLQSPFCGPLLLLYCPLLLLCLLSVSNISLPPL